MSLRAAPAVRFLMRRLRLGLLVVFGVSVLIFTLAIERLGEDTPRGSGLLCLAIVGGAVIPLISGYTADRVGLSLALLVPAACYLWIAAYGALTRLGIVDRRVMAGYR